MNHQRYLGIFALALLTMLGLVLGWASINSGSVGVSDTLTVLPPTWTPTATRRPPANAPVSAEQPALSELLLADATATPTLTVFVSATLTIAPAAPAVFHTATPVPVTVLPPKRGSGLRIDEKGPVALLTAVPLLPGDGSMPVRLQIPALHLDVPIEPMGWFLVEDAGSVRSQWQVVDQAAGHHIDSAYPGEAGNVVLSGHNNIGGSVFRTVCVIGEPGVDFGIGDAMIVVAASGQMFTYTVNAWQRIPETNASPTDRTGNNSVMQQTDHAQLTLITCWPPDSNTHRVIVTGLLTSY